MVQSRRSYRVKLMERNKKIMMLSKNSLKRGKNDNNFIIHL